MSLRNTKQYLLPTSYKHDEEKGYNIYPTFEIGADHIKVGYNHLAEVMKDEKIVLLDGYVGVFWEEVKEELSLVFQSKNKTVQWINMKDFLKSEEEIDKMLESYLGEDDSIFGYRYDGTLRDYYDEDKLKTISVNEDVDLTIVYGCGAYLTELSGLKVYIDLPKNEIQFRARAGAITNLGASKPTAHKAMYKYFYFIDWIVLNRHKENYYKEIQWIVDGQRPGEPVFMAGQQLQKTLDMMKNNYFRVRPWFEPGAWGGQFMKEHFKGLAEDVPNYAWSFELIVPENGLIFSSNDLLLEVSFDFIMYHDAEGVLGQKGAERFGTEFPIRIDYLDTMNGGNLSVQCHPRPEYIKKEFGENFTQDETYYIMECSEDADVYLGFQEDIREEKFRNTLEESQEKGEPINIERYVQKHPAHKHDLFLIPNGTIHASGSNNLVLEISSTPYIFTFKMYDWMRLDLDGKPRPINIERGFENLYFDRKGKVVKEELISKPKLLQEEDGWKQYHVPTHKEHFYDVHRYEIIDEVTIHIEDSCHVLVLAEGKEVILKTEMGYTEKIHYGETFVIPYSAGSYSLSNEHEEPVKLLKVFLK